MFALIVAVLGAAYPAVAMVRAHAALGRLEPRGADRVVAVAPAATDLGDVARSANDPAIGAPVKRMLEIVAAAASRDEARVDLDEYLSDLDAALGRASASLTAHGRVSLTAGTFSALLALIRGMHELRVAVPTALGAVALGSLGVVAAAAFSRRAAERARRYRVDFDRVVGALGRWL